MAKRLHWSLSKVQRIEIGEVAVSEGDLRQLLTLLGVDSAEIISGLVDDARLARRERWSTPPEHRKYLSPGVRQLLQLETAATEIRSYQHFVIPGLLQTPEMARYIVDQAHREVTPEEQQVRFEVRLLRRKQVVERLDGPRHYLLLDESVLMRRIGGKRVMAEQLEDLAQIATQPNIYVRVMPLEETTGAIMGVATSFILLNLSDDEDDVALYRENFYEDSVVHDADKIRPYREGFERLWEQSLSRDASIRRIMANAMALRIQLDQIRSG